MNRPNSAAIGDRPRCSRKEEEAALLCLAAKRLYKGKNYRIVKIQHLSEQSIDRCTPSRKYSSATVSLANISKVPALGVLIHTNSCSKWVPRLARTGAGAGAADSHGPLQFIVIAAVSTYPLLRYVQQ